MCSHPVEPPERARERDVCERAQRRLLTPLAACEAGAPVTGPQMCVQGGSAETVEEAVEEAVEILRDRALHLAACEQPLCHGRLDAAGRRLLRLVKQGRRWRKRRKGRRWWKLDRRWWWEWRNRRKLDRRDLDRELDGRWRR